MPRCHGRGICGCGRPECAPAEWWFRFGLLWWLIAFEITESTGYRRNCNRKFEHLAELLD